MKVSVLSSIVLEQSPTLPFGILFVSLVFHILFTALAILAKMDGLIETVHEAVQTACEADRKKLIDSLNGLALSVEEPQDTMQRLLYQVNKLANLVQHFILICLSTFTFPSAVLLVTSSYSTPWSIAPIPSLPTNSPSDHLHHQL